MVFTMLAWLGKDREPKEMANPKGGYMSVIASGGYSTVAKLMFAFFGSASAIVLGLGLFKIEIMQNGTVYNFVTDYYIVWLFYGLAILNFVRGVFTALLMLAGDQ